MMHGTLGVLNALAQAAAPVGGLESGHTSTGEAVLSGKRWRFMLSAA